MPALIAAWRAGFWPCAGAEHLAEDHFVDVGGVDLGALQRGLDGDRAEVMGGNAAESSVERSNGGPRRGNDHDFGRHIDLPKCSSRAGARLRLGRKC